MRAKQSNPGTAALYVPWIAAARLMRAVERVTADPALHTPDLGGTARTRQVTDAVCEALRGDNI